MLSIPKLTKWVEYSVVKLPRLYPLLVGYYSSVLDQEIELANITCDDRVLCIGIGPCPITAIEIAKRTGATVIGVDNDQQALKSAQQLIDALGLTQQVQLRLIDGREIDPSGQTVVHLACQVVPRDEVLRSVLRDTRFEGRVLVRNPQRHLGKFYQHAEHIPSRMEQKKAQHRARFVQNTLLFAQGWGWEHDEKSSAGLKRSSFLSHAAVDWVARSMGQSAGD